MSGTFLLKADATNPNLNGWRVEFVVKDLVPKNVFFVYTCSKTDTTQAPLSQANPPPTPGRCAASSTVGEDGEERGDLIKFYNAVFLPLVQVGV